MIFLPLPAWPLYLYLRSRRTPIEGSSMQLCKLERPEGGTIVGLAEKGQIHRLRGSPVLSDLLHGTDPAAMARSLIDTTEDPIPFHEANVRAPIDHQEVWAAGVTYIRSKTARERESAGAARFYDLVYTAPRPELFFKATPRRVVGPGQEVRIRRDSRWSVPEPEVALMISPDLRIVGYTIGNDMSSRDIEGENPLYLPQAKIYTGACALGPVVTLPEALLPPEQMTIRLTIRRSGAVVFEGSTSVVAMARPFTDLVAWLGKENTFPDGVILLTGTGVVPPDDFTLAAGDEIAIEVAGIGVLANRVA
jgi:2-dehydro-3-deoxy-D-arabinonate dehydratase